MNLLDNSFLLLFTFLLSSTGVIFLSFLFTEAIKNILDRFKLSENFVGASLLAAGTSLSEAINALVAGFYDKYSTDNDVKGIQYSLNSLYNLTGAISVQVIFLSSASIILWKKVRRKKLSLREYRNFISSVFRNKTILWSLSTVELTILSIAICFAGHSKNLTILGYNSIPFFFFLIWALFLIFSKKTDSGKKTILKENYLNIFQKYSNKQFILLFTLIFIFFTALSFLNFNLVSKFEKVLSIPKNIGLGAILSIITSLPEFSSFFFLFRSKCYDTASAGFFGSAIFNLMLPCITQLIKGNWIIKSIESNSQEKNSLIFWIISTLAVNILFACTFYKSKGTSQKRTLIGNGLNIGAYIFFSLFFPIFFKYK